jgi:hypothetical protein
VTRNVQLAGGRRGVVHRAERREAEPLWRLRCRPERTFLALDVTDLPVNCRSCRKGLEP